jgi:ParB family chromosome partitioning protein
MTELIEQPGESRLAAVKRMAAAGALGGGKKEGRLIVSLDRISEDPHNERRTFRNMDGLIASVKSVGLIEPLTVTPEGDNYRIVTGHRRYRAARAAGLVQVEVLIREPDDERLRRQKSLVSNVQREDIGPVELAEALRSLIDDDIIDSQKKLAAVIGKDKTWVSRMLRILDLPIRLRVKVASTQLSLSYDAVAEIARLTDPKHQDELVDAILSGATQQEIRQRIREIKGQPTKNGETPKPKKVYHTDEKATVIVQSETQRLTLHQAVAALQQALKKAKDELIGK